MLTCIVATSSTSVKGGSSNEAPKKSFSYHEQSFDARFIKKIHLTKPEGVIYKWQSTKDSRDVIIQYVTGISVNYSVKDNVLKINSSKEENKVLKVEDQTQNTAVTHHGTLVVLSASLILSMISNVLVGFESSRANIGVVVAITVLLTLAVPSNSIDVHDQQSQSNEWHINVIVPIEYIQTLCVNNDKCYPTSCQLSSISPYSTIPSNNRIVFSGKFCSLRKPEGLNEWMLDHFAQNVSLDIDYYLDPDNDGLVNILEYYSKTDPRDPDSDHNLLLDGFEYANGITNKTIIQQDGDEDVDGLTNLEEQIFQTNLMKADTDMDGINDGNEVNAYTNPRDLLHGNTTKATRHYAMVELTIGDDTELTERYVMHVGDLAHQSNEYGKVSNKTYRFLPGKYTVSIQHIRTIKDDGPDYDYIANIKKISGKTALKVKDPYGILGKHRESSYDVTLGKTATMIIEAIDCNYTANDECACRKTCKECQSFDTCEWNRYEMGCRNSDPSSLKSVEECPCSKCAQWYEKEMKDTSWKVDVREQLACPCRADVDSSDVIETFMKTETVTNLSPDSNTDGNVNDSSERENTNTSSSSNNNSNNYNSSSNNNNNNKILWQPDPICQNKKSRGCGLVYPGAYRCIYSVNTTLSGASQHCCYDKSGDLLTTTVTRTITREVINVAGSAVRVGDVGNRYFDHVQQDILPYKECCLFCQEENSCKRYDQVRGYETSQQNCTIEFE